MWAWKNKIPNKQMNDTIIHEKAGRVEHEQWLIYQISDESYQCLSACLKSEVLHTKIKAVPTIDNEWQLLYDKFMCLCWVLLLISVAQIYIFVSCSCFKISSLYIFFWELIQCKDALILWKIQSEIETDSTWQKLTAGEYSFNVRSLSQDK